MYEQKRESTKEEGGKLCLLVDYHAIVVTVDHDGPTAPQVDIFLPPITHLEPKQSKFSLSLFKTQRKQHNYIHLHFYTLQWRLRIFFSKNWISKIYTNTNIT